MAEIIVPDEQLQELRIALSQATTAAQRLKIAEQIAQIESKLISQPDGVAIIEASKGGLSPNIATPESFKGKTVLSQSTTEGVYSATKYDPVTGQKVDLTQTDGKKVYYDIEGKEIPATELVKTSEGRNMAAAGYDIGYGAGKIGPGATDYAPGYKAPGTTDYNVMMGLDPLTGQPREEVLSGRVKYTDPRSGKVVTTDASGKLVYADGTPYTSTTSTLLTTQPTDKLTSSQEDIYSIVVDRLNRYNLASLAPLIKKLAIEGATEATIMLRLQEEPLYQERFKANQSRISKGLKALTPSEYLAIEDDYRQVLRAYGLKQFDNDAYVSQFLANDISVSELSNRVVAAVQRVRNADPAISSMLKNYYGISNNDLVAYVLDPNQQFQKIERQIAASEIGVAAKRQGLDIGVPVAEQLAAQGITQAEAQRGYATIADILPTAQKLSDIYGKTLEGYGLAEAEQEVFNQLASAQRKRRALTEREVAAFSGTSGLGRTSLTQQSGGQF